MNFDEWANDYATRFPAFGNLIDRSEGMFDDFRETFIKFSVDVLRKATREMTLLDPQPFPNEHMPKLYARCKSLTMLPVTHSRPVDPNLEPRYKCLACRDDGVLQVYHPKAYKPIKEGTFRISKHLNYVMCACTCEAGEIQQRERRYMVGGVERVTKGLAEYNPDRRRIVNAVGNDDQAAELTEFVLAMKPKYSGFEAYQ